MRFKGKAPPRPLFRLSSRFAVLLTAMAAVATGVQFTLGASPVVAALAWVTVATSLLGFVLLGPYNVGAWVVLFYGLGNVVIALYAKTLMLQPLGSYLYDPVDSFLALAVVTTGLLAVAILVRSLPVGRSLLNPTSDPRLLSLLSWACFGLGVLFWFLNRASQDPTGSGFGGFAQFRDLLVMAVISRTAMVLEKSQLRKSLDGWLVLILMASVALGFLDDAKLVTALPVVAYFATLLFYHRGLRLRIVAALAASGLVFVLVVAPLVHALRASGQQKMNLSQRVQLVTESVVGLIDQQETLSRVDQLAATQFEHPYYYNYFGGNAEGQMMLGRYASVQQIDPVMAAVRQQGTVGGAALWPALSRLVPSVLDPGKPKYTDAFTTLVHYGLVSPTGGQYPTLPLAGQAYAGYGWWGLAVIPMVTFAGFLLVLKKVGWQLNRNVYAIFFLCEYVVTGVHQGSFGQLAGATLRGVPLFVIVFWGVAQLSRLRFRRVRPVTEGSVSVTAIGRNFGASRT